MKKHLGWIALVAGLAGLASAAFAASAFAPFGPATAGASASYHITGSNDGPDGPKSFDQTVTVNRAEDGTLSVLSGTDLLGSVTPANVAAPAANVPSGKALLFTPFKHIVELLQNRPADVTSGTAWKATSAIPFGSQTLLVPLDVTATVDGDAVKLTAHGTLATTIPPPAHVAQSDVAVTADETAEYTKGQFTGLTVANQEGLKMELSGRQGVVERSYSSRYNVLSAIP